MCSPPLICCAGCCIRIKHIGHVYWSLMILESLLTASKSVSLPNRRQVMRVSHRPPVFTIQSVNPSATTRSYHPPHLLLRMPAPACGLDLRPNHFFRQRHLTLDQPVVPSWIPRRLPLVVFVTYLYSFKLLLTSSKILIPYSRWSFSILNM